jgi:hypothetical protein
VRWRDQIEVRLKPLLQMATISSPALAGAMYRFARHRGRGLAGGGAKIRNGNWQGNDTCWRMALDLNRALLFADRDGALREAGRRKPYYCIVDAMIAGEGNGPLDPTPVQAGLLIAGDNPAHIDAVAARLMGFAIDRLPIVWRAFDPDPRPIATVPIDGIVCEDERSAPPIGIDGIEPAVAGGFRPHFGWPDLLQAPDVVAAK